MENRPSGWSWFEAALLNAASDESEQVVDDHVAVLFARTFQGRNGNAVLAHLKAITLGRTLGPNSTDALLRHLEGQRQLVSYIVSLIERGSGRPLVTPKVTSSSEQSTENNDD